MGASGSGEDVVAGEVNEAQDTTVVASTGSADGRFHGGATLAVRNLPHSYLTLDANDNPLPLRGIDGLQATGYRHGSGVVADAAYGAGVVAYSGTDGVRGIAGDVYSRAMWKPEGVEVEDIPENERPQTPLVGVRGVSLGDRDNSVGVVGSADNRKAKGVVGNSAEGVGVMGISSRGIGIWAESASERAGVFMSGQRNAAPVAQIRLVPTERGNEPGLPKDGKIGDLFVKRVAGDGNQVELWFCVDADSQPTALWAPVTLGAAVAA